MIRGVQHGWKLVPFWRAWRRGHSAAAAHVNALSTSTSSTAGAAMADARIASSCARRCSGALAIPAAAQTSAAVVPRSFLHAAIFALHILLRLFVSSLCVLTAAESFSTPSEPDSPARIWKWSWKWRWRKQWSTNPRARGES